MRALTSVALAFAIAIVAIEPLQAGEAPPPAAGLPAAIGSEVVAVLRVDDSQWLMEQLNAAIGGNGPVAATGHAAFAELLYNCRSTSSIDPARPALIAWRTGEAPLVAIIPFLDRERFLEDFGSLRLIRRLLVRTGEREGTVIYNQVTPQGTWEYRLMLRDGYAYLARSKEECLLLADHGLRIDTAAPPIHMAWSGSYLAELGDLESSVTDQLSEQGQSLMGPLAVGLISGWRDLLGQISLLELRLEPGADGSLGLRLSCGARNETALATWLSRQSNAGSRLLPLVTRPGDVLTMHGSFRWQGELERLGRALAAQLSESLGAERFTEQMNADMRGYFTLLDRQGAFATAMGFLGEGEERIAVARVIAEQPNAADLITLERGLDKLFMGEGDEVGEFDAVSGLLAYRKVQRSEETASTHTISAAGRDHLLKAIASDPQTALVELRTMIASLGETHVPEGAAGVFALRLHVAAMIAAASKLPGTDGGNADPLSVDLACRVEGGRSLLLDLDLPLAQIQEHVVRVGLLPDPDMPAPSGRRR